MKAILMGSRLFSRLTTAEIYSPIQKYEQLQKLNDLDRKFIVDAFQVVHPIRDHDIEIVDVEFFIDPEALIPSPTRNADRLSEIDFVYITEQISKCDNKIALADFEGAVTNARNLMESICKYILDCSREAYNPKSDLPVLYKKASHMLNMHPSQQIERSFKQILSGGTSIIQGLASIRNELSDAHGKSTTYYKPDERHAMLSVGVAKSLAEFMFASYSDCVDETA